MESKKNMDKEWYFIIKGKSENSYGMTALLKGRVFAETKNEARELINAEYGHKFPLRDSKNNKSCFILGLYEMNNDPQYLFVKKQFEVKKCRQCKENYTIIDRFNFGIRATQDFCSPECGNVQREENRTYDIETFYSSTPVIYKITQKSTNKCYIGQTIRSFTLRWWEHLKSLDNNKFHSTIKDSDITDWKFEVIEVCQDKDSLNERELYWINFHDSVKNGFNSVLLKR